MNEIENSQKTEQIQNTYTFFTVFALQISQSHTFTYIFICLMNFLRSILLHIFILSISHINFSCDSKI